MKYNKIMAVLTGALLLSGAVGNVCLAKDHKETISDSIRMFSMSMLKETAYEGEWISFYDEFQLYLPVDWKEYEIADSDLKNGIFYQAGKDGTGENIVLSRTPVKESVTLKQIEEDLKKDKYETVDQMVINDIPAVRFRGMKIYGLSFLTEDHFLYTLVCAPESSEMTAITDNIFISLSLCDE